MLNKPHSAWDPLPAGVFTSIIFGGMAVVILIGAFIEHESAYGFMALFLGATAIYEACSAAFHAGLRTEAYAEQWRRERMREHDGDDGTYL